MESKRERILKSAEGEFLEKGFDGTSIDAIVRAVGGSKSTVYAHFKDKTILFAEALSHAQRELDFSLLQAREAMSEDVRETLELIGAELLTTLYRERTLHLIRVVVSESQRFPAVAQQFWDEGPAVSIDHIARVLTEYVETGELSFSDPMLAARHLFGLFLGDRFLRFVFGLQDSPSPEEIASISREAVALFLSGEDTG